MAQVADYESKIAKAQEMVAELQTLLAEIGTDNRCDITHWELCCEQINEELIECTGIFEA